MVLQIRGSLVLPKKKKKKSLEINIYTHTNNGKNNVKCEKNGNFDV